MNFLIIGPFPDPITGVSLANQTFTAYLKKNNISFSCIDTISKLRLTSKGGSSFSFKKATEFLKTYLKLHKILSANVVYLTPGQTFYGVFKYMPFILGSIILRKPYIIHLHGNYLGREYAALKGIKRVIFKFMISKAAVGIALSDSLRENFDGLLSEEKVVVLENFVNTELFSVKPEEKKYDLLRLLYLSNLMEEKGIVDVLDALLILKNKGIAFKAVIAGEIEKKIEENTKAKLDFLKPEVEYKNILKERAKLNCLREANVFLLPTYYKMEGQPISILEAMATGNLVITTYHAGIPDIVNEKNAIFVNKKDSIDIAKKLEFISENMNILPEFTANNIAATKGKYTEENFGSKLLNILKNAGSKEV